MSESAHQRHGRLVVAGLVLATLAGRLQAAQTGPESQAEVLLNGEIELARLVDFAAERLDLNVEYDRAALQGKVTLRLGGPISDDELWSLTNSALAARGFTTVRGRDGTFVSVVKADVAPNLGRLEDLDATDEPLPGFVTVAVEVKHRAASQVVEALKTVIKGQNASVQALLPSNIVLLSDARPRVEQALELLEFLDTEGSAPGFEVVPVTSMPPGQIATSAAELMAAREAAGGSPTRGKVVALPDGSAVALVAPASELEALRGLVRQLDAREARRTETYTPRFFSVAEVAPLVEEVVAGPPKAERRDESFRVVADALTGTLIVTGTATQHAQVASLIARLDAVPREARRQVRAFPVKNRNVREMAALLEQLIAAEVIAEDDVLLAPADGLVDVGAQQSRRNFGPDDAVRTDQGPTPPRRAESAAEDGEKDAPPALSIAADEETNTLLAVGEPRLLTQLEALLERLDVRQPQVMLEVLVLSLTESDTLDLGVELRKFDESGSTQVSLASVFGLGSTLAGAPNATSGGFTGAVLSPGDFSILLRALATVNEGRSLTMPKVLVNNNEQATLNAVLQQPFLSTNASDTVATTSFGGTQDAGTTVTVRPQIAEGNHLRLEYQVSLSEFVGESSDPSLPPPRQQNNLSSVVAIPDGYAVVVGGLEVQSEASASSQVPWLGELPLFGPLFGTRSGSSNRSRFFVFLRASVLRQPSFSDLRFLSDRAKDALPSEVPGGWPEVKPRVIE